MFKYNLVFTFVLLFVISSQAQDKHFTQFYASPLTLNPALTGVFEGKYRLGAVYRDQWRQVLDNPYVSFATNLDLRLDLPTRSQQRDKLGIGLLFFRDKVGGIEFSTTQIAISGAYHKSLNFSNTQYLSLGVQTGLSQRNVNFENLTFGDEFNGTDGYDRPTAEVFPENNFSFKDLSVGLNYTYNNYKGLSLFAGAAYHHILQPSVSFYDVENVEDNKLFAKISTQLAAQIGISDNISLSPRLLFALQGPHFETNVGSNVRFLINDINGIAMHLGSWVRLTKGENEAIGLDALVALLGFEYSNVMLGFSYDINLKDIGAGLKSRNAFEVSAVYLGEYESEEILCPKF